MQPMTFIEAVGTIVRIGFVAASFCFLEKRAMTIGEVWANNRHDQRDWRFVKVGRVAGILTLDGAR